MFTNSSKAKPIQAALSRKKSSKSSSRVQLYLRWIGIPLLVLILLMVSLGTSPSESNSLALLESSASNLRPTQKELAVIQVAATGKTLPSAKNLLTQKPPFDDSTLIRLSDNLITSPNTVVTGYFRVRSKYSPEKYDGWMKNMLSLQDPMIIFTHADVIDQIKQLRSHALDRTVIVPLDIDQLPYGTLYSKEFWQDQLERDPEIKRHKSYELFWIWLSKSYLVNQAIRLNVFQSDLFMWSDIGCFRDGGFNSKTMIQHRDMVPPHEMLQMAHHKPNPPKENLYNDKYQHKDNFYHSGSQFVAFKDTWIQFHQYFLEVIDAFLEKNMIIVEDQAVLQSVCLSHPEICAYVPFNQVNDNHYFGLRHVLHNGGEYKYWRYNKKE